MQQWEYLYVSGTGEEIPDNPGVLLWRVLEVNGAPPRGLQHMRTFEVLEALGNDGWELVQFTRDAFIFKRPKGE